MKVEHHPFTFLAARRAAPRNRQHTRSVCIRQSLDDEHYWDCIEMCVIGLDQPWSPLYSSGPLCEITN